MLRKVSPLYSAHVDRQSSLLRPAFYTPAKYPLSRTLNFFLHIKCGHINIHTVNGAMTGGLHARYPCWGGGTRTGNLAGPRRLAECCCCCWAYQDYHSLYQPSDLILNLRTCTYTSTKQWRKIVKFQGTNLILTSPYALFANSLPSFLLICSDNIVQHATSQSILS